MEVHVSIDLSKWREWKEEMWERLVRDIDVGYMDQDIVDVLEMIFKREHSFTISSCSGRVTAIDGPMPWDRKESTIVFKKHQPISKEDLEFIIRQPVVHKLWLIVTGPIIHVVSDSLEEALEILRIAREAGMKHSGILSISDKGIISELRTGVRLAMLIKYGSEIVIDEGKLDQIVKAVNEALLEGKERLDRLRKVLRKTSGQAGSHH